MDDYLKKGPVVAVLDSMDGLIPEEDLESFEKNKQSSRKGKEESGSYGTAKAKINSSNLRVVYNGLDATKSILLVISQTRDKIGFGSQFNPHTRSGGTSLTFYANSEIWFSVKESIKKNIRGKNRKIGTVLQAQVKKNRDTGYEPTVELVHYPSVGFDDIGGMVEFLIEEKHWKGTESTIEAPEFDFNGKKEKLIQSISEEELEGDLREIVRKVWDDVMESCRVQRKSKY